MKYTISNSQVRGENKTYEAEFTSFYHYEDYITEFGDVLQATIEERILKSLYKELTD